jgi:hypothetical protein
MKSQERGNAWSLMERMSDKIQLLIAIILLCRGKFGVVMVERLAP